MVLHKHVPVSLGFHVIGRHYTSCMTLRKSNASPQVASRLISLHVIPLRGLTLRVSNMSPQVDSCLILLYVIVQAQDYRLGHIHASMAATLVLDVIASEAKQSKNDLYIEFREKIFPLRVH